MAHMYVMTVVVAFSQHFLLVRAISWTLVHRNTYKIHILDVLLEICKVSGTEAGKMLNKENFFSLSL